MHYTTLPRPLFSFMLVAPLLLAACADVDTRHADYGQAIDLQEATGVAKKYLADAGYLPGAATWQCSPPLQGHESAGVLFSKRIDYGYLFKCTVDAADADGRLQGARRYEFVLHGQKVIAAYAETTEVSGASIMEKIL